MTYRRIAMEKTRLSFKMLTWKEKKKKNVNLFSTKEVFLVVNVLLLSDSIHIP